MKKVVFLIFAVMRMVLVQGQGFENYISTSGDRLMDGNKVFRFISVNVPTLNYQEDVMDFTQTFLRGDDENYDDLEWDSLCNQQFWRGTMGTMMTLEWDSLFFEGGR